MTSHNNNNFTKVEIDSILKSLRSGNYTPYSFTASVTAVVILGLSGCWLRVTVSAGQVKRQFLTSLAPFVASARSVLRCRWHFSGDCQLCWDWLHNTLWCNVPLEDLDP